MSADNRPDRNSCEYAQERTILAATEEVSLAMERRGVNKVQLAARIESSKSHVTQLLSGSRNMTIRTLAELAYQLGCTVTIKLEDRK